MFTFLHPIFQMWGVFAYFILALNYPFLVGNESNRFHSEQHVSDKDGT